MIRDHMNQELVVLLPPLRALVPPAEVIDKQHYSPFVDPALHQRLQEPRIDSLVISGAETDVCVLAAVLDAVD